MYSWRTFIIVFWVFVGGMLAWQAYNYNNQVAAYAQAHPEQHAFYDPNAHATQTPPKAPAPDVRQAAYQVIPDSPQPGSFTVRFTVKNQGNAAATSIQVKVRPYRGILNGQEDNGHAHGLTPVPSDGANGSVAPYSDDDPVSQYGQWVNMPDLAPGQSASDSVIFAEEADKIPNENPKLEIDFEPAKPK